MLVRPVACPSVEHKVLHSCWPGKNALGAYSQYSNKLECLSLVSKPSVMEQSSLLGRFISYGENWSVVNTVPGLLC